MVAAYIAGGLGNQLFQYAIGRCIAIRRNTELKLYVTLRKEKTNLHHGFYQLDKFNIKEDFITKDELKDLTPVEQDWVNSWIFQPEILDSPDNIYLAGNWQTEKYFVEIRDILLKELTLKNPLGKISAAWKEKILTAECSVSLHVRHGDNLMYTIRNCGTLLYPSHYVKCVNTLKKEFPNIKVFVFSDDMQWCKENLKFDVPTEFVEGCEQDTEELYLMSLCSHNIISRGTFAWWGAWLNQNPDKKVLAPSPWNLNEPHGKDIIPDSWIKVPADYVQPIISIIFNVEDNSQFTLFSLMSIFSQNFRAYEIIWVDSSADAGNKIYRQFAGNPNVSILKTDPSTSKLAAWNKGLDVARGDYVLFLTSKDFIFPHTAHLLSGICDESIRKKGAFSRNNYITSANFETFIPNIISGTQSLEEHNNGTAVIKGLPNKNFLLKVDNAFKQLNAAVELNLSNEEKLMALSTRAINREFGTKFFKRSFLNENNIRFRKGGGMDAELLFLVETFMCTEKIMFVPQVFYGRLK